MSSRTLTVGSVQVTAVCDVTGDFPAPLKQAFPQVEEAAWAPWRHRHPGAFGGPGRWRLRDWCFVVRARDRVVLVDTGVGGPGTPGASWIGIPGRLPEELAAAGVEPGQVDLVVLTHLHLDHIGWNLAWDGDQPRPRFPRASYLVQRADWELFASRGDEAREAFDRCVAPLQALGVAELVEGDAPWTPSSACSTPPGTPPAPRACWSGRGRTPCSSGATSPTTRPRSASPTAARTATSCPRWPRAPAASSWTASRPRACGWPRPTSPSRSAP
jgi:hypothetical protein